MHELLKDVCHACKGLQDAMQRQQVPIAEALPPTITHMKSGAQVQHSCLRTLPALSQILTPSRLCLWADRGCEAAGTPSCHVEGKQFLWMGVCVWRVYSYLSCHVVDISSAGLAGGHERLTEIGPELRADGAAALQSRLVAFPAALTLACCAGLAGGHERSPEGSPETRADGAAAAAEQGAAGQAAGRAERCADRRRSRAAADSRQVCHASFGSPHTTGSKPDMV